MFGLSEVRAARTRIGTEARRTPLWTPTAFQPLPGTSGATLHLKLEHLQVSGSFKARGAFSKILSLSSDQLAQGVVTASGGNHGVAVAHAAWRLGIAATICLPQTVHPDKIARLEKLGARVVLAGDRWDAANREALAIAASTGMAYVHPFADPEVAAGQGVIALEIFEDMPQVDTIIVAIGGGGLITGIAAAAKELKPSVRIVGVEPVGAPTMKVSIDAGKVVPLETLSTAAVTLAAGYTDPFNLDVVRRAVDELVLVSDDDMRAAARWLWSEFAIGAELSGAASAAALLSGAAKVAAGENVCLVVCGAGRDGLE